MKARAAQLLTVKDSLDPALNDVVRVYCDDGSGFRESLKYTAEFVGLSGSVNIPVDHDCRALRIAPIKYTKISDGVTLDVNIEKLEVVGSQRTWRASDMKLDNSSNLTVVDSTHFSIIHDSAFIDYSMGSQPRHVKSVTMKMDVAWKKLSPQ